MSGRETVTQRVYRRRAEASPRSFRNGRRLNSGIGLSIGENRPAPKQQDNRLGSVINGLLVLTLVAFDGLLWYAAANGYPEAAGPAFVGAPIAFMVAFGAASSR